jgi:hypothetical protein
MSWRHRSIVPGVGAAVTGHERSENRFLAGLIARCAAVRCPSQALHQPVPEIGDRYFGNHLAERRGLAFGLAFVHPGAAPQDAGDAIEILP